MMHANQIAPIPIVSRSRFRSATDEPPRELDTPPPTKIEPYKTHLAYVKERRSDKEAADILDEALQLLRSRRKSGDIIF